MTTYTVISNKSKGNFHMKKFIVLATLLVASLAQAEGLYTGLTYDQKDKQNSAQVNHVFGVNVGQKFSNGLTVEGRMENERVAVGDGTQKQEGLMQVKASYDISTGTFVTPYVAAAVGQKQKSTVDFTYWVGEVGAKAKINDTFGVRYGWRQRTAFDNNSTNSYDTKEHTIALTANLSKADAVSVAYKRERGTSDYNTTGLYYTRSF
jgi:hypothetical protein